MGHRDCKQLRHYTEETHPHVQRQVKEQHRFINFQEILSRWEIFMYSPNHCRRRL